MELMAAPAGPTNHVIEAERGASISIGGKGNGTPWGWIIWFGWPGHLGLLAYASPAKNTRCSSLSQCWTGSAGLLRIPFSSNNV